MTMPIPADASAIHGIFDADVASAPMFKNIAHELYEWMKGCDLGGYNSAKFDLPLLAEEFLRAGVQVDFTERHMVDVQQIFFKMESRTLSAAYQFYCNKPLEHAHSAEADIMATVEILEAQLDKYDALEGDVAALQIRLKTLDADDLARAVDFIRPVAQRQGVAVILNDHPDLAFELGLA